MGIMRTFDEVIDDILNNVDRVGECLIYRGATSSSGYGAIHWKGRMQNTHRLVLEYFQGPSDLYASHLCHNKKCVNRKHLVWETNEQNSQRNPSYNPDFYPCGHPRTEENTYHQLIKTTDHKTCLECRREHDRRRYAARS